MQIIVCWFLFIIFKNAHVSSLQCKKLPLYLLVFRPSSLPDFLEKPTFTAPTSSLLTARYLAVWFYTALQ